ncbi:FMN-linked oxidoreductase [Trichodelitschia bisporula]|uniref:FMN-linked oxidoreductase n=1 Tax=Trichodelitschia bisporula TaxID=703511 RepID=A0A6G1I6L0_9PEZI|nr:FMN-linked oxidoreductase [Trichodelitschia bisporula]
MSTSTSTAAEGAAPGSTTTSTVAAAATGEATSSAPSPSPAPPLSAPHVPIPKNGVDYRRKIVLAPMVRSGELPMRLLSLKYGADLVWGPETIDRSLIGCTSRPCSRTQTHILTRLPSNNPRTPSGAPKESILYRLHPGLEHKKLIFQLGSANPALAVAAATLVAPHVAGIDLNAGCPKPFSTSGGMGAALLRDPDRLCSILEALVTEVGTKFEIGISVKIRVLETPERTEALVRRLVRTGITGLTVHCRTPSMRPRERAIREQVPLVVRLCKEAGVAILLNGDVTSRDEGLALATQYGADGAMIATAAEKNPSVFRAAAECGLAGWQEVVREYVKTALAVENRWGNTKFSVSQLLSGRGANIDVAKCKSHVELVEAFGFEDLLPRAREVDEMLGVGRGVGKRVTEQEEAPVKKVRVEERTQEVGAGDRLVEALEQVGEAVGQGVLPGAIAA